MTLKLDMLIINWIVWLNFLFYRPPAWMCTDKIVRTKVSGQNCPDKIVRTRLELPFALRIELASHQWAAFRIAHWAGAHWAGFNELPFALWWLWWAAFRIAHWAGCAVRIELASISCIAHWAGFNELPFSQCAFELASQRALPPATGTAPTVSRCPLQPEQRTKCKPVAPCNRNRALTVRVLPPAPGTAH